MSYKAQIIEYHPLVHEFFHLTICCPMLAAQALPGHYVTYQHQRLYILTADLEQLTLIVPPSVGEHILRQEELQFFSLKGTPLKKPEPDYFYLMLLQSEELAAGLFYFKKYRQQFKGLVLIGAQTYFPFKPAPAKKIIPGIPHHVIAAMPLLEEWGIANRLCSEFEQPGIFHGTAEDLKKIWLQHTPLLARDMPLEILTLAGC